MQSRSAALINFDRRTILSSLERSKPTSQKSLYACAMSFTLLTQCNCCKVHSNAVWPCSFTARATCSFALTIASSRHDITYLWCVRRAAIWILAEQQEITPRSSENGMNGNTSLMTKAAIAKKIIKGRWKRKALLKVQSTTINAAYKRTMEAQSANTEVQSTVYSTQSMTQNPKSYLNTWSCILSKNSYRSYTSML